MTLTQALEGYHRIVCGGSYLTRKQYEPVYDALKCAIPNWVESSHRDKLKGMLTFGYEYSLQKRIEIICTQILRGCIEIVEELLGKPKTFAHKVTQTRNSLTHPDVRDERGDRFMIKLSDYVRKMEFLLRLCFLKEIRDFP